MRDFQDKTAAELRQMAIDNRQRSRDSFDQCDTDGFLSQWASDLNARLYDRQADIVDNGGQAQFIGLYFEGRRIRAKEVTFRCKYSGRVVSKWLLDSDEIEKFGRKWVPTGENSRVQKQLGLCERREWAPAEAMVTGSGTGLSGAASAGIGTRRTGDEWGQDTTPAE